MHPPPETVLKVEHRSRSALALDKLLSVPNRTTHFPSPSASVAGSSRWMNPVANCRREQDGFEPMVSSWFRLRERDDQRCTDDDTASEELCKLKHDSGHSSSEPRHPLGHDREQRPDQGGGEDDEESCQGEEEARGKSQGKVRLWFRMRPTLLSHSPPT